MTRCTLAGCLALVMASTAWAESARPPGFDRTSSGELFAWNAAQRVEARVSVQGIRLVACRDASEPLEVALRLRALRRGPASLEPAEAVLLAADGRAELRYDALGLSEQYTNDARGVEQTFVLERELVAGGGALELELELASGAGTTQRELEGGVRFASAGCPGGLALRDVVAWDANGAHLSARLAVSGDHLTLSVDDAAAVFPITIDPVATGASYGYASYIGPPSGPGDQRAGVSTAGDLNGDGYSDVAFSDFTTVRVLLGSANGPHPAPDFTVSADSAGYATGLTFGASLSVGDVNGDGYDDLVVGAPGRGAGEVYVWFGGHGFPAHPTSDPTQADWVADGNVGGAPGNEFGRAVSASGDVDCDGAHDITVGAPGSNRVYVFRGGDGLGTGATLASAPWHAEGDAATRFGAALTSGMDLNGDTCADVVVGAPLTSQGGLSHNGAVLAYLGVSQLSGKPTGTASNAQGSSYGAIDDAELGYLVSAAGDVDGDGYGDVLVTQATQPSSKVPRVELRLGVAGSTAPLSLAWSYLGAPDSTLNQVTARTFGDADGNGLADIAVLDGQVFHYQPLEAPSSIKVFFGRLGAAPALQPDAVLGPADALYSNANSTQIIAVDAVDAITAGDVNGDGYSDLAAALTVWSTVPGIDSARGINVYYGGGYPTAATPRTLTVGEQGGSGYGLGMGPAGDLNGDGFSDYVAGAPYFSDGEAAEGRFTPVYGGDCNPGCTILPSPAAGVWEGNQADASQGWSVTGAGDVNGDGFDDVIVGAPLWDRAAPLVADAGRIQIYLGGSGGLATSPSLTLEGQDGASAQYGYEVAGAGDVNGDGRSDVLVAAPYASAPSLPEAGKVYLYLGAATPAGIDPTPAWTRTGTAAYQHLGIQLASAGDVNGDGRSDVILAELNSDPNGASAALIFQGEKRGLAASPAAVLTGVDSGADDYGITVASAGDVNGDHFADVAVGEAEWNALQGQVRVYLGGSGGVSTTPATTLLGTSGGRFGSAIGGGGDVDGDGYGDLAVGEQWSAGAQGRVHVYRGGSGGLSTVEAIAFSDTPGVTGNLGRDVSINLDLNGDGFSDLIASAFGANGGVPGTGAVFVHMGGGANGVARHARMVRVAGGAPLALLGTTSGADTGNFSVQSLLRSAGGVGVVRSVIEAKPLTTPFDGTNLGASNEPVTTGGGTTALVSAPCASAVGCHWRLRLRTRDPFFPGTPWFSPPGNAPTELDLHGLVDPDGDGVSDLADLCPTVADPGQGNADLDLFGDACDDCPTLADDGQADADGDAVGDVCDSCVNTANPRVTPDPASYLAANPWATLTGGQRDDDHDGYGNKCDAKFPGVAGAAVGPGDLAQFRTANNKARTFDVCGTSHTRPCAIFDLDELNTAIGPADLTQFRLLNNKAPGPRCPTCPLACAAGTAGTCGPIP